MFPRRSIWVFACIVSCRVYDESLLGDAPAVPSTDGQGRAGAGAVDASRAGAPSAESPASASGGAEPMGAGRGGAGSGGAAGAGPDGMQTGGSSPGGGASPAAGTGGAPNPGAGEDVVDDMEDGNFFLSAKPPRFGYWYVAGDNTFGAKLPKIEELVAPLAPARGSSANAVHFEASGFEGWGASVGLTFADSSQKRSAYDAGNALGITFWLRGVVGNGTKLRVLFPLVGTDPSGNSCGGSAQGECLDHFASQVAVPPEWQQVTILFSALRQAGWGAPLSGFDPAQLLGVEWTAGVANTDVWIDDLALLRP